MPSGIRSNVHWNTHFNQTTFELIQIRLGSKRIFWAKKWPICVPSFVHERCLKYIYICALSNKVAVRNSIQLWLKRCRFNWDRLKFFIFFCLQICLWNENTVISFAYSKPKLTLCPFLDLMFHRNLPYFIAFGSCKRIRNSLWDSCRVAFPCYNFQFGA